MCLQSNFVKRNLKMIKMLNSKFSIGNHLREKCISHVQDQLWTADISQVLHTLAFMHCLILFDHNTFFGLVDQTLPPIRHCTLDNERNRQKGQRRFKEEFWPRPEPPKPFLLHLGVTARTHGVSEFQQNFPEEYSKYHIDRYRHWSAVWGDCNGREVIHVCIGPWSWDHPGIKTTPELRPLV